MRSHARSELRDQAHFERRRMRIVESLLLHGLAQITEDALTASLGDLLEDLGKAELLQNLLSRLHRVQSDGKPLPCVGAPPAEFGDFKVQFWPDWKTRGIPDLVKVSSDSGESRRYGSSSNMRSCTASKGGRWMGRVLPSPPLRWTSRLG